MQTATDYILRQEKRDVLLDLISPGDRHGNYWYAVDEMGQRQQWSCWLYIDARHDRAFLYIFIFCGEKIALGVAYALWEGVGILLITLFSVMLFDESLSVMKIAGLATLVAGIVLIKSGTRKAKSKTAEVSHAAV